MRTQLTRRNRLARTLAIGSGLAAAALAGCSTYKESDGGAAVASNGPTAIETEAQTTLDRFREKDPTLRRFFENAYALAIFPRVAKGAAGIGAAHGNGVVFKGGQPIAYTEVTQGTIGIQLGGQTYSELVFFQSEDAFNTFRSGKLRFQAQASAVATESGAAASHDFAEGVAVFTMPRAGLMFEAAIGGQQFTYTPRSETAGAEKPASNPATASAGAVK